MRKITIEDMLLPNLVRYQTREDLLSALSTELPSTSHSGLAPAAKETAVYPPTSEQNPTVLQNKDAAGVNTSQLQTIASTIGLLNTIQQMTVGKIVENSWSSLQSATPRSSGTALDTIQGFANTLGGFGISPTISGFLSIFSGGHQQPATTLSRYAPPPTIAYESGIRDGIGPAEPVSYGERELPRTVAPVSQAHVSIQVNAIDSRSFLDHSEDIARAVRQAILTSSPLNDVIGDL